MGTSGSSKGPGANVPMVPPWVPEIPAQPPTPPATAGPEGGDASSENTPVPSIPAAQPMPAPLAPAGRFAGARRSFGDFAKSGDTKAMRRGLGHYVKKGYGGGGGATQRFGGTVSSAGTLYGVLSTPAGTPTGAPGREFDPAVFAGRSAREIMDAIVESVRPADGTQDAEASRKAIKDALSDLLDAYPEANPLELNEDEKGFVIEQFVAIDVYQRLCLDIGEHIQTNAPTPRAAGARFKEIKAYIREVVANSFRKLKAAGEKLTTGRIKNIVTAALRNTFAVFERESE
jgi:hypothetical protein